MIPPPRKIEPRVNWGVIDTVLLDMDGTLLDKHFDDYFWLRFVPENYALKYGGSIEDAQDKLYAMFQSMEGTLDWTDLDYWSRELGLDIPALKVQVDHLIRVHPYVIEFLDFCRSQGKHVHLVTNAHSKTLAIKMDKTALGGHFDRIICAEEIGMAKEESRFWQKLHEILPYDQRRTLLADDTEAVLHSANKHGIRYLIYVARPSSRAEIRHSSTYPSIIYFKELFGK
jgi:HAD superfamily hydrolase (TIGR01509 family)